MRIITCNVNGIRSAARKGFFDWFKQQDADVLCLQETKAQEHQLDDDVFQPPNYHAYFSDADKKGYSGVAIYSKYAPDQVIHTLGFPLADTEGRFVEIQLGRLSIVSLYLPSGSSGELRQALKYEFMAKFGDILQQWRQNGREYVLCGDWNIAHKPIDLENWRANQKSSGFLPEERDWMDQLIHQWGFVDAFRVRNQEPEQYTWWSMRSKTAWDKNVGWRIDYQIITPDLAPYLKTVQIYRGEKFSDHAPVSIDYDFSVKKWR